MSKPKKNITVFIEDSHGEDVAVYSDVKSAVVEDGGTLQFVDEDGDIHFLSPAIRWHAFEQVEAQS